MSNKLKLGFNPIDKRVYLGRQKDGIWSGDKRDVTNDFLQVMEHKFPINTAQNISINGENRYRVLVIDMDKEITINGRKVDFLKSE